MYRILCFGDSNTWGYNPENGLRLPEGERWAGVFRKTAGEGFEIIEDGQNGRRLAGSLPLFQDSLFHNSPIDVVIFFLGINDIIFEKEIRIDELAAAAASLADYARSGGADADGSCRADIHPEVVFISGVPVNGTQVADGLYELEAEKVLRFGEELRRLAEEKGCGFIDSGRIVTSSDLDGVHLDAAEHHKLGLFVYDYILSYLKNRTLFNRHS